MARAKSIREISVPSGGGTETIDPTEPYEVYHITGSVTLSSSWTISLSTTGAVKGQEIYFRWRATVTPSGNTVKIGTYAVDDAFLDKQFDVTAYFDGSSWNLNTFIDHEEDSTIIGRNIATDAVVTRTIKNKNVTTAKLEDIPQGSVWTGDGSNRPTTVDNSRSGNVLIGDGTTFNSRSISGDVTIDKGGNATIPSNTVSKSQLDFTFGDVLQTTVILSNSDITSIGTSPVTILSAQGTNTAIDVISSQAKNRFNSSAYTLSSETLDLQINSNTVANFSNGFVTTSSTVVEMADLKGQVTITENSALEITTSGGTDPGGGSSSSEIEVKVLYKVYSF